MNESRLACFVRCLTTSHLLGGLLASFLDASLMFLVALFILVSLYIVVLLSSFCVHYISINTFQFIDRPPKASPHIDRWNPKVAY